METDVAGRECVHPTRWRQGKNLSRRNVRWLKNVRKKRRRGRETRRVNRVVRRGARLKTRPGELTAGTFNVRTLAVNDKNGLDHAEEIMEFCRQSQCDTVGLQENTTDGQDGFKAAGVIVY